MAVATSDRNTRERGGDGSISGDGSIGGLFIIFEVVFIMCGDGGSRWGDGGTSIHNGDGSIGGLSIFEVVFVMCDDGGGRWGDGDASIHNPSTQGVAHKSFIDSAAPDSRGCVAGC